MHSGLLKFVPGILLRLGRTVAASAFEAIEVQLFHEPYLEALVLAIILGVVIRSLGSRLNLGRSNPVHGICNPQVLAATLPIGALSNQIATVVKLVLMLGLRHIGTLPHCGRLRSKNGSSQDERRSHSFFELVPWFITGFLLVAALRSMRLIPKALLKPIAMAATAFTTVSTAALGLGG